MGLEQLQKKINNILEVINETGDYGYIRQNLSIAERVDVLHSYKLCYLCSQDKKVFQNLFLEEEADALYETMIDASAMERLLEFCSDKFKFELISHTSTDFSNILATFKSNANRLEAFNLWVLSSYYSKYSLNFVLNKFDSSLLEDLIDILCKHNGIKNVLGDDFFVVNTIVKILPNSIKLSCLEKLLESGNFSSNLYFVDVIKNFDVGESFDVFLKLNKYYDGSLPGYHVRDIMNLAGEQRFVFFDYFLNNNLIDNYYIGDILKCFSDEEKYLVISKLFEYQVNNPDEKLVTNAALARIVLSFSDENRVKALNDFVFSNKDVNHFVVIKYLHEDVDFRFKALDLKLGDKLSNLSAEEKYDFFEQFNNYVVGFDVKFCPSGGVIYENIISFYSDMLALNKDNLISFINKFGYESIGYLKCDSVKYLINLDKVKFDKFMGLFNVDNLTLDGNALNTVVNSVLQREFMIKFPDIYNIFDCLETLINVGNFNEVEAIIYEMSGFVNIRKILEKNDMDMVSFLEGLKTGKVSELLSVLHDITNQYIMKKREKYVNKRLETVWDELDLEKKYEKNWIKKKWVATTSEYTIKWEIEKIVSFVKDFDQLALLNDEKLLMNIIKFKKNPKGVVISLSEQKYLKAFDGLLDILYERDALKDPTNDVNAKYVYFAKSIDVLSLLEVVSEIDMPKVDVMLLSNDRLFKEFSLMLFKYKLLGWGKTFESFAESADFESSYASVSSIFNYFDKIDDECLGDDNKRGSITKIVALANCYMSSSSKYGVLFSEDVYRLLAVNSGKNKASMLKYERLKYASLHVYDMYMRNLMPIPTMDRDIELDNGKSVNVVIGNTTSMINLVLGELTDSCMRVGGAFDDFYKECLFGKNGFHIVFYNPYNGEFISRVSGIRNGNTVFLNELRNSECDYYTDIDCVDALRMVSSMLIEESRNSEFPVDNVVITADYAMGSYSDDLQDLGLVDRNSAVLNLHHNLSNDGYAIVLATSRDDGKLVDIELGADKISYYTPQRDKVREYCGVDAVRRCRQLKLINSVVNGINLADVDMDDVLCSDMVWCVSGEDWFIGIDNENNVVEFILDSSVNKERMLSEISEYRSSAKKVGTR